MVVIILIVCSLLSCKKDLIPSPDLVEMLVGTYKVKEVISVLTPKADTTRAPYVAGKVLVERSVASPTKIGLSTWLLYSDGINPLSEEMVREQLQKANIPNPQDGNAYSVYQKNDTIYFANNITSGTYFKGVLTRKYIAPSNLLQNTVVAIKE